ncbi:hypothetical protein ID866_9294 [Astraeus odoratus]|nr:hypothetical protein ID866_9294 [Astraeus odoratus]
MGPSRKLHHDEVKALLREKDEQIAALESQLEAHSARASTAHVRLLKTIDVLDSLRAQHTLEMASVEEEKMKLARDVDRWRVIAQTREVEKDEMKDVVEDLIQKIQISNEWSSWPCSRMQITKYAEVRSHSDCEPDHAATNKRLHHDLLAYASSIIARLRCELEFERHEHHRTAEEANMRIDELEAKVAVREAELETWTSLSPQRVDPNANRESGCLSPQKTSIAKRFRPKPISDEECLRVLESNSARNKSLEMEIHDILAKLEKVRIAATSSGNADNHPIPLSKNDSNSNHTSCPGAFTNPETHIPLPSSTIPTAVYPPVSASMNIEDLQIPTGESTHSPGSPSTLSAIAQLDNHIRSMSAQTDALKVERSSLVAAAAKQKREMSGMKTDRMEHVLRIEEECIRLSAQVHHLQQQLEKSQVSARAREEELLQEIHALQLQVKRSSLPNNCPGPFDADIAEENMQLATPLQPTSILSAQCPERSAQQDDPSLIPLPFSPERESSPFSSPPRTSSGPSSHELQRAQDALMAARDNLAQKESVLARLRTDVDDLRRQVPHSKSPDAHV